MSESGYSRWFGIAGGLSEFPHTADLHAPISGIDPPAFGRQADNGGRLALLTHQGLDRDATQGRIPREENANGA